MYLNTFAACPTIITKQKKYASFVIQYSRELTNWHIRSIIFTLAWFLPPPFGKCIPEKKKKWVVKHPKIFSALRLVFHCMVKSSLFLILLNYFSLTRRMKINWLLKYIRHYKIKNIPFSSERLNNITNNLNLPKSKAEFQFPKQNFLAIDKRILSFFSIGVILLISIILMA